LFPTGVQPTTRKKIIIYEGIVIIFGPYSHGKPGKKAKSGIEQRKGIKSATALCKLKKQIMSTDFCLYNVMYSPCQGQNQSFKSCEILLLDPEPEAQDA